MKLDEEMTVAIEAQIKAGVRKKTAARTQGIDESTFHRWLKKGRAGVEAYKDFATRIDNAEAECEADSIKNVRKAGVSDWRAEAWWLSKMRQDPYGDKLEVAGGIDLNKDEMTDEEMVAKVMEILEGLNGTDGRKP